MMAFLSNSLIKAGSTREDCPGPCPVRYYLFPQMEALQLFCVSIPVLHCPYGKKSFFWSLNVFSLLQLVLTVSCYSTMHSLTESTSFFSATLLQVVENNVRITPLWPFLMPNLILCVSLHTLCDPAVCIVAGIQELDTKLQLCSPKCQIDGNNYFPRLAACAFSNTALDALEAGSTFRQQEAQVFFGKTAT